MNKELNIIVLKLADIGKELNRKFGTDSYLLRCDLFDIREELSKLSQHDVSGQSELLRAFSKWYEEKYKFQISEEAIKEFDSFGS